MNQRLSAERLQQLLEKEKEVTKALEHELSVLRQEMQALLSASAAATPTPPRSVGLEQPGVGAAAPNCHCAAVGQRTTKHAPWPRRAGQEDASPRGDHRTTTLPGLVAQAPNPVDSTCGQRRSSERQLLVWWLLMAAGSMLAYFCCEDAWLHGAPGPCAAAL